MGALLPNGNDLEVINELNDAFSGAKLTKLRKHINNNNDDFFGQNRRLRRIAWRLNIWPTQIGDRPKGRWFTFLDDPANGIDQNTHEAIRQCLRESVGNPSCLGIRFWARHEPNLNSNYAVECIQGGADANGKFWLELTLKCLNELNPALDGDPTDPLQDGNERGNPHPQD